MVTAMDNVNHLNELSIQSPLSTLKNWSRTRNNLPTQDAISKLSLVPYSRNMELQTSKSKREIEKSLCTNWWSQPKRRRVSPLHAQYIVVSNLHIMTRTTKLSRKRYLS